MDGSGNKLEIKSVRIEAIDPESMRYRTVGDWVLNGENLLIQVADTGDSLYNLLLAIHELVEVVLCANKNISQEAVDRFDMSHEDDEDPGSHPEAPYHQQHMTAFGIEMILAGALGLKWREYEESVEQAFRKTPRCAQSSES